MLFVILNCDEPEFKPKVSTKTGGTICSLVLATLLTSCALGGAVSPSSGITPIPVTISQFTTVGSTSQSMSVPVESLASGLTQVSDTITVNMGSGFQASNILAGVTIFGLTGTATTGGTGAYSSCSDNVLNVSQCSTAANRYVTSTAGSSVSGSNASLAVTIPRGYYTGTQTTTASDSNLSSSNIISGVSIFGTTGSASAPSFLGSGANRDAATIPAAFAGVLGSSGASYTAGVGTSSQITIATEEATYGQSGGGALLPSTGGYNYRDIPDGAKDSEGYYGTDITYALRPTVNCGSSGTIATRVTNCASLNPSTSSWNGAVNGNSGQGTWNLVSRIGANKEVWQDARTGLIWSSLASGTPNWCRASGNIQYTPVTFQQSFHTAAGTAITGNGTISSISGGSASLPESVVVAFTSSTAFTVTSGGAGCNTANGGAISSGGLTGSAGSTVIYGRTNYCSFTLTQGSTAFASGDTFTIQSNSSPTYSCYPNGASGLQPTNYISYCSEQTGYYPGFAGDSYTSGWSNASYTYDSAKGGMGRTSTYPVYWRLPTLNDYEQAQIDGIRYVMPDMGAPGSSRAFQDGSTGSSNYEWSASLSSNFRYFSWYFDGTFGSVNNNFRYNGYAVRCVGR